MKLSGVMVNAENPKVLGEFYTKVFGKPGWQQDDWYGFDIGGTWLMVGPHSEVHGSSKEPYRVMFTVDSEDVKGDFEKVKAAGATVIAEPYLPSKESPDMWLSTLADPEGNYLQIASPWKE